MSIKRAIYYDTETTGTRPDKDRIVEIAAFDPHQNRSFSRLVNPQGPIPKEATAIHGITDAMVESAATFADIAQEFVAFCGEDCVLIAHNNDNFDRHFLTHEAKRASITLPNWQMIDTLKWARKYRNDLPRHTLQFLRQIYGIAENQAHRALDDVVVLHQIFSIMIDDLPLETVLQLLMEKESNFETMRFGKHQGKLLKDLPPEYVVWLHEQKILDKPDNSVLKEKLIALGFIK